MRDESFSSLILFDSYRTNGNVIRHDDWCSSAGCGQTHGNPLASFRLIKANAERIPCPRRSIGWHRDAVGIQEYLARQPTGSRASALSGEGIPLSARLFSWVNQVHENGLTLGKPLQVLPDQGDG